MYEHSYSRKTMFHCWFVVIFKHMRNRRTFFTTENFGHGKFQTFVTEVIGSAFWDKQVMYPGNIFNKDEPICYYF